ncbi:MAG: hypothetical protein M9936_24200 [Caldilinea sp.]|nr:hypothetical protein [Caldilinea sp.]MCB0134425.1 hypothetical protein [Caldilineaceae bacterium]MCB0039126.1 hypothetical protein [Caldilinea sp.]MCB0048564.1 hypothetical protein [Caldilinea sp.]MCB9124172.1 hypothetical protein [Caldilineaceae bacterium]
MGLFLSARAATRTVAPAIASGVAADAGVTQRKTIRTIAIVVGVIYFASSLFIFRGVAASIPQVLDGTAVINGDELVPFFNPTSQLIDQAAGKFNQLTNGYEFRVRYAFLTTWMRYYKVLPFAIILVIPSIAYAGYLAVSWFLCASFKALSPTVVYTASASPVAVIFLIMTYSKITHFYTLVLGFSMFLIAAVLVTYGLIFATHRAYWYIAAAAVITLFNPAVHYLILFALYQSMTVGGLILLEMWRFLKSGLLRSTFKVRRWLPYLNPKTIWRYRDAIMGATFTRAVMAMVVLGVFALLPYGLFVKFVALRGVPNLSETVPGDFYFITDASIAWKHLLALDMAGIMDKMMTGDYLAKEPRYANVFYTIMIMLPLFLPVMRRTVFDTPERRKFVFVIYLNVFFSMWATLGYSEPEWLPTFHRTIALISRTAYGMQSTIGDLVLMITSTIVQVLRFPHRFELILFMVACILMPISLTMIIQWLQGWLRRLGDGEATGIQALSRKATLVLAMPLLTLFFMVPLFSSWQYRDTFFSGNMMNFLAPYPVTPLKEVKNELLKRPPGKVVVLPPTETAKVIVDIAGVEHKFIDKFHLYYLDLPSFYYGLTGDSDNKYEFFLLLRALYYQQDWWVNIARDLDVRYIVINRELIANTVGGAEYLREIEKVIIPELDQLPEYLQRIYENESYVVYEFTDLPKAPRVPLFIDTGWSDFIKVLSSDLNLTRYYDLRHTVVSDDLTEYDSLALVTDDPHAAALDLYIKADPSKFFSPASNIYAFSPETIPSSYYLSPMFRLFQFFSDSKWNRLNMITPGLFGTIKGSFIGVPRATRFRIAANFPASGEYHILLRGAATVNEIGLTARTLGYDKEIELRATPDALTFFDQRKVFSAGRSALDIAEYTADELELLIPTDVVAINNRYKYFDLGTVEAKKGKHTFYFDKKDGNPLLVEGILVIPEEEYQKLSIPENVHLLDSSTGLCCGSVKQDETWH